jgi:hypothetical protein
VSQGSEAKSMRVMPRQARPPRPSMWARSWLSAKVVRG